MAALYSQAPVVVHVEEKVLVEFCQFGQEDVTGNYQDGVANSVGLSGEVLSEADLFDDMVVFSFEGGIRGEEDTEEALVD